MGKKRAVRNSRRFNKWPVCLYIILNMLFLFSCDGKEGPEKETDVTYFIKQPDAGLYVKGECLFRYTDTECQTALNELHKTVRLQTDWQERYVNILFSSLPLPEKGTAAVQVKVLYKTEEEQEEVSLPMVTVKKQNGIYWLWNDDSKTGIILSEPDFGGV